MSDWSNLMPNAAKQFQLEASIIHEALADLRNIELQITSTAKPDTTDELLNSIGRRIDVVTQQSLEALTAALVNAKSEIQQNLAARWLGSSTVGMSEMIEIKRQAHELMAQVETKATYVHELLANKRRRLDPTIS